MPKLSKLAVIGGSGLYNLEELKLIKEHQVDTPFGHPSSAIKEFELDGHSFYMLPRHGVGHFISPSEVNYRANIFALKKLGCNTIVSVSAVGSLKEEFPPGMFVLPDQFVDWTKGKRERSFFGEGVVGHVSTANPIEYGLRKLIAESCERSAVKFSLGGSYICIEGPQFSTRAESAIYRSFGCSVIGMTNVPEAYLAKEAGMAYATVAMVTDYDCWKEEHCTVEEILKVMNQNNISAQRLIKDLVPAMYKSNFSYGVENEYAVITDPKKVPDDKKPIIDVLLS